MEIRPRTIQIFLPSGEPRGLWVSELTTSIVRVIEVPRKLRDNFLAMDAVENQGRQDIGRAQTNLNSQVP